MSAFALSQLLIGVAFVIDMASFQFRQKRHVLMCLAFAASLIGTHFLLLEIYTAAVLGFVAAARFITALFTQSRRLYLVFVAAVLINAWFTWAGLLSALGTLGALLSTTAAFSGTDQRFRLVMMASSIIWVLHNSLAGSPAALALECVFLGSNMVGYYRFYLRPGRAQVVDSPKPEEPQDSR